MTTRQATSEAHRVLRSLGILQGRLATVDSGHVPSAHSDDFLRQVWAAAQAISLFRGPLDEATRRSFARPQPISTNQLTASSAHELLEKLCDRIEWTLAEITRLCTESVPQLSGGEDYRHVVTELHRELGGIDIAWLRAGLEYDAKIATAEQAAGSQQTAEHWTVLARRALIDDPQRDWTLRKLAALVGGVNHSTISRHLRSHPDSDFSRAWAAFERAHAETRLSRHSQHGDDVRQSRGLRPRDDAE